MEDSEYGGIRAAVSTLSRASGSADWAVGSTKVIASVSGPVSDRRDETAGPAVVEVVVVPSTGVAATAEQLLGEQIAGVVRPLILRERHPRTVIQVVVQIVQEGEARGSRTMALAAGINAAVLALVDGGVPLRTTVAACSVVVGAEGEVVNPTRAQLDRMDVRATHTVAYEMADGECGRLAHVASAGVFSADELAGSLATATAACARASAAMRQAVAA
ncbi:ribosomal protein S5 domain 2-type protein [Dipodascopsis tothii]|uniref:ribosomal protein S5 domain 2-type protein n=1 Tax=Dipodascopsis tothii TaxID=44089 RepID=UPI0034CDB0B1